MTEERNGDGLEVAHAQHGRECDQSLHRKAHPRTERMDVVSPAEVGDDRTADEVDEAGASTRLSLKGSNTSHNQDDDDDGESPATRSGRGMGTALVGMIHNAAAFGVLTDDPHAEGGEDGEECEDEN